MGIEEDIKSLKIQGAKNITIVSLRHLEKFSESNGFGKEFEVEARRLDAARPTAVMLHNALDVLLKSRSTEAIHNIISRIEEDDKRIASSGRKLIKNGFQVHTHCHSTEVMGIIKEAARENKFIVIADETRPMLQGIITARELSQLRNVRVIFIVDSAAGLTLSGRYIKKDDIVIVGADAMRQEGIFNKVGTYPLAVLARENNIPFYIAASTMKIDRRKRIEVEERPPEEVYKSGHGEKIEVRNPAFDMTPWEYIKGVITEKGVLTPKQVLRML